MTQFTHLFYNATQLDAKQLISFLYWGEMETWLLELIRVLSTKLKMTFAEDNNLDILTLHSAVTVFVSDHEPVAYLCLFCHQQNGDRADPQGILMSKSIMLHIRNTCCASSQSTAPPCSGISAHECLCCLKAPGTAT